jgi:hypothetical protein
MQRQDLIRQIIRRIPNGSLRGLDSQGQQVIQISDREKRTKTFATLEMLSLERLSEIAMQLSEMAM